MNGAQALIRTLVDSEVDVCFTNPGTSEMHFVAAVDQVPGMRTILGLFEGVVTGAADGYGRMAGRPAATLLHLGPGLGNGLANLHNARRAFTPVVNIVGDHATYHQKYDAPLQSDIESIARPMSGWVHASIAPDDVAADAARAVVEARRPPGQVATLVLPADVSWLDCDGPAAPLPVPTREPVPADRVDDAAAALRSGGAAAIFVGGSVLRDEQGLRAAARVAAATGAKLLAETFPARLRRGAGIPAVERLGYLAEFAAAQLDGLAHLVIADTVSPVSFFAYPDKASDLVPDGCEVHVLAAGSDDAVGALEALADALGAPASAEGAAAFRPDRPTGALDGEAIAAALGALLPEEAIVVDEGNTAGLWSPMLTAGAAPHDWLTLTGGAIGYGMPTAIGAAVACPDRKVVNLQADGSAMYTLQALWTQAREGLDVTTIIFNNGSYAILNLELTRVGAEPGPQALRMLDLTGPSLDFVSLAKGMGVSASRATTAEELTEALERGLAEPGPVLIDAVIPAML